MSERESVHPGASGASTLVIDPTEAERLEAERRAAERTEVAWAVDCEGEDTFLFAAIINVSALGLFVRTEQPLPIGTRMRLSFAAKGTDPFRLLAEVAWINRNTPTCPNPGMGMRFLDLHPDERERLVEVIRTIAYLRS